MAEPYSPLRYPGGKARLAPFFIELIRHNNLHQPVFVETYAGGAGAALRLLFEEYVDSILINDADPRIFCFWQAATNNTTQFLALLDSIEVTVAEWHQQKRIYEEADLSEPTKLGFATFFLNRTNRSGIIHNGGPIGGYQQNGTYSIDARFNRQKLRRKIERLGAYSDRIEVTSEDGLDLLLRLSSTSQLSQDLLVYLDPPYYGKGPELYLNKFSHEDHAKLARFLNLHAESSFILTYDNVPEVRELYRCLPQRSFVLGYSAYSRRTGSELLVHSRNLEIPSSILSSLPNEDQPSHVGVVNDPRLQARASVGD